MCRIKKINRKTFISGELTKTVQRSLSEAIPSHKNSNRTIAYLWHIRKAKNFKLKYPPYLKIHTEASECLEFRKMYPELDPKQHQDVRVKLSKVNQSQKVHINKF